jgi:branched-subunit amino acid aminotransferase/4-amino-4-deoxychorismate lyase
MAKFEGIRWADKQMRYMLTDKSYELLPSNAPVAACSRSTNYAIFLAFEGIRFFCRKNSAGRLEIVLLNWHKNLERFRRGMAFNIGAGQESLVPSVDELETILVKRYFAEPAMRPFFDEMAAMGAQGYLRPFTVDEEQSIGVTFPNQPSIRALASRYDRYLGEPFGGVVISDLVRAVSVNRMGWLKLGVNYLVSIKAIEAAKKIWPEAAAALFLDDQTHLPIEDRQVTEWDTSCCLFAFRDGTVIKIPESPLILPSVTIQGITAILRHMNVRVEERHLSYGELLGKAKTGELAAICSIGTAGILNRCAKLLLVDGQGGIAATHVPDKIHPLYTKLAEARTYYWDIYKETAAPLEGMTLYRYEI